MNSVVIVIHCYHSHNFSIGLLLPSGSLCHPLRPSALDNFLLDLHNSSYHTQPHYMAGGGGWGKKKRSNGFHEQNSYSVCTSLLPSPGPQPGFFLTGRCHPTSRWTKQGRRRKTLCGGEVGGGGGDLIFRDCISCVLKAA